MNHITIVMLLDIYSRSPWKVSNFTIHQTPERSWLRPVSLSIFIQNLLLINLLIQAFPVENCDLKLKYS